MNTGFRRARGKFVLLSLIDLLYPDELMSFIASKRLQTNEVYRADRCDVNRNVLQFDTSGERLNFCRQNILRIHSNFACAGLGLPELYVSGGDFQLMPRAFSIYCMDIMKLILKEHILTVYCRMRLIWQV